MGVPPSTKLVELRGVCAGYVPGRSVLHDVSLAVDAGECTLVVGHNGAGKTTLLLTVFGLLAVTSGEVEYRGKSMSGVSSSERVRQGMAHVIGGRGVFPGLTVRDNLKVAVDIAHRQANTGGGMLEKGLAIFPEVGERLGARAGELSGGQQRMLALCMALAQEPVFLLLDEPSLGLSPIMVDKFYDGVQEIRRSEHVAVLVVEQTIDPRIIRPDQVVALQMGKVLFEGSAEEAGDGSVLWAYV